MAVMAWSVLNDYWLYFLFHESPAVAFVQFAAALTSGRGYLTFKIR